MLQRVVKGHPRDRAGLEWDPGGVAADIAPVDPLLQIEQVLSIMFRSSR
jgi:hypothetical protein